MRERNVSLVGLNLGLPYMGGFNYALTDFSSFTAGRNRKSYILNNNITSKMVGVNVKLQSLTAVLSDTRRVTAEKQGCYRG
jgi:hypothetical protein